MCGNIIVEQDYWQDSISIIFGDHYFTLIVIIFNNSINIDFFYNAFIDI